MAQDEFSTMMGWEGSDELCSISELKEYLQTPNLSSKEKSFCGWVFWYPKMEEKPEFELLEEYGFAQIISLVQQNSNVCEEDEREKIKSVLEALTSRYNDDTCIVQFWGKKVVAGQLCLTTVGQPFAVVGRLRKGYCWYRKHCEDHQYYIVKEEEVGSVGRAFLNKKVESSPDLRLYSIQEFPLRNQAARTGLRRYLAMPVFDLLNNECYGVLEILSQYTRGVAQTFRLLNHGLKEAGLRSTHIHSSPINFFNGSEPPELESEIVKMMESAMEAVPQLQTVQVWTPCMQCVTTTCLKRTAFINSKDKKLNSCNKWEDWTMFNFLEACEVHHLQIEEWIGRPLMSVNRRSSFCRSICDFSICEYPLAHYAQKARLSFCFVIHLQNIYDSNNHCFLEFFVQPNSTGDACDASFLHLLLRIMEMELKNFKFDKSIFELRKTSALGYEYVEWKHQHSEEVNMLTVMKGHTEKYSLSDFKIYLQTPDLFCMQPCKRRRVWLFWREEISYNEVNNNRGLQEEIRKLMIAIASKWVWRQYSLVQFWALGMNESRPCLQTSHQPFALGSLSKGLAFFRKQCMERRYFVDDGAAGDEVGPPQRVFRSGHHESTPDLHLYSTTEFPLRDHALHCCLKRYISFPILDQQKKCIGVLECFGVDDDDGMIGVPKCIGVLECVGVNDDDDKMIGTIRKALKATSLSSTHINFKPTCRVGSRRLAEIEILRAFDLFRKIPQLFHKDVWVTYNKCDSISSNICCMKQLECANTRLLNWPINFHQVQTGKGIVGMVLASENKSCFCRNLCDFSIVEQPRSHYLQRDRLDICFAICLQSSHTGNLLYVLQFFLCQGPAKFEYLSSFLHILFPILKQELTSFKVASGQQLGDDLVVDVIEFPQGNKFTSSELDESYSSPFKFKIVHYGQKKPQHSIDELRHFDPHVMDSVPSVLQEKSSNAVTSESREKGVAKEKIIRKRDGSLHIRLEDLEPHFGKTLKQAAEELRVGRSTIKRKCIDRWPDGEKYIQNPRLFEAAGTSHDFQHSHGTNLPLPYMSQPVTELQPEAEMVMVKAKYEDEIIKFKLCLSATMNKIQEEVAKRLDLEIGSFKLRYLDEDNDKILLTCDDDLQLCLKCLTAGDKTCVQVFVQLIRMGSCSMKKKVGIEETPGDKIHFHEEAKEADEVIILTADQFLEGKLVELRVESRKDIVAYGAIVRTNVPNEVIHGKKFPSNCMRVAIDEVVVKNVLLPIPTDELQLIGDAVGSLVAWPKHLIAPQTKMVEKTKKVKEVRKPTLDPTTVPRQLNVLYCYMKLAKTIKISLQKDVFGIESDVHIDFEDVDRFCRLKPISVSCIVVYIWHMFKQLILQDRVSRFKFVDPNGLGPYPGKKTHNEDGERRAHNLLSRLAETSSNQVLLVPSNIGDHWILTVIDPHKSEVYVLDPLYNGDIDNIWMTVVNWALRLFDVRINKNSRKSSRWSVINSPRQPDCEQCGFFVLCYMKQIMETNGQMHMRSLQSLFTKMSYSVEEINEMRVEWAECIQEDLYA